MATQPKSGWHNQHLSKKIIALIKKHNEAKTCKNKSSRNCENPKQSPRLIQKVGEFRCKIRDKVKYNVQMQ